MLGAFRYGKINQPLTARQLGRGQCKWLGLDRLGDPTAANALGANSHAFDFTRRGGNLDALQVRTELSLGDTGYLGTDAAQILGHTANLDLLSRHGLFATNFTFPSHLAHLSNGVSISFHAHLARDNNLRTASSGQVV